jgi:hypothetical protein
VKQRLPSLKVGENPGHSLNAPCKFLHAFVSVCLAQTTRHLCGTSAGGRLDDLGHLRASTHDAVACGVLNEVLVLAVGALPDLDLHAAADDTNAHSGEKVVGGVGVVVDTAVEHGGGVLANTGLDHGLSTRVVVDEIGNIVDNTSDSDQATAVLSLVHVVVPLHDGELLKRNTPVKLGALLVKLLLLLLETALLNLVGAELLEVVGETHLLPHPDGPLGRVILVPLDSVAVVGGELVVEVVVALAESDKSGDDMVTRAVAVVEGLVAEPVGKGVDTEGGLLDEEDAEDTSVDEASEPVTPAETGNESGENETHEENDLEVVLVLPDNNGVVVEVRDVGTANSLGVLLHEHPTEVRVEKTLPDAVGVLVGVGVAVVSAMVAGPPSDGTLNGTATNSSEEDLEREAGRVGCVCPQTVVAGSDTETSSEVEGNGPDGSLQVKRCPVGGDETAHGNTNDQDDIEPVDVLVPVLLCHGSLSDVRLLGVVGLVPDRLLRVRLGGSRGLAGEVGRVHGGHAGDRLMRRHLVWEGRSVYAAKLAPRVSVVSRQVSKRLPGMSA